MRTRLSQYGSFSLEAFLPRVPRIIIDAEGSLRFDRGVVEVRLKCGQSEVDAIKAAVTGDMVQQ